MPAATLPVLTLKKNEERRLLAGHLWVYSNEVDVARWCLGETMLPRKVMSIGGRFLFNDACDVPNTQIIYYDFPTAPVLYEVHNLRKEKGSSEMPSFRGERVGVVVDCEGGSVSLYRGIALDKDGKEVQRFSGGGDHFVNFIEAVRKGDRGHLNAEVEVGHISTAVTHTGNISLRVGEVATAKQQRDAVDDTPLFNEMYDRFVAHLAANEIDLNTATLGEWLDVDTENEHQALTLYERHGFATDRIATEGHRPLP